MLGLRGPLERGLSTPCLLEGGGARVPGPVEAGVFKPHRTGAPQLRLFLRWCFRFPALPRVGNPTLVSARAKNANIQAGQAKAASACLFLGEPRPPVFPVHEKSQIKCPHQRDEGPRAGRLKPYSLSGPSTESWQAQLPGESGDLRNEYKPELEPNSGLSASELLQRSTRGFGFWVLKPLTSASPLP